MLQSDTEENDRAQTKFYEGVKEFWKHVDAPLILSRHGFDLILLSILIEHENWVYKVGSVI